MQDAEDGASDDQGDAEQGFDALLAQDQVEDVGVVDVGDRDGAALGGDAAREAAAEGDAHALLDFLLDALGGTGVQRLALEQEDRDGVDLHDVGDPLQQLLQQVLLRQVRHAASVTRCNDSSARPPGSLMLRPSGFAIIDLRGAELASGGSSSSSSPGCRRWAGRSPPP